MLCCEVVLLFASCNSTAKARHRFTTPLATYVYVSSNCCVAEPIGEIHVNPISVPRTHKSSGVQRVNQQQGSGICCLSKFHSNNIHVHDSTMFFETLAPYHPPSVPMQVHENTKQQPSRQSQRRLSYAKLKAVLNAKGLSGLRQPVVMA